MLAGNPIGEGFSPRNGEIILKTRANFESTETDKFQSPQWGNNSKANVKNFEDFCKLFQSPQWGNNSKGKVTVLTTIHIRFSPRNGEIILKTNEQFQIFLDMGFSPRNGEIILKYAIIL